MSRSTPTILNNITRRRSPKVHIHSCMKQKKRGVNSKVVTLYKQGAAGNLHPICTNIKQEVKVRGIMVRFVGELLE